MLNTHQTMSNQACQRILPSSLPAMPHEVPEGTDEESIPWPARERWLIGIAVLSQFSGIAFVFAWWLLHRGAVRAVHLAQFTRIEIATAVGMGMLAGIPMLMLLGLLCVWGRRWSLWAALFGILIVSGYSGRELYRDIMSYRQRRTKQAEMLPRARAAMASVMERQHQAVALYKALASQVRPSTLFVTEATNSSRVLRVRRRLLQKTLAACFDVHGQFQHHWKSVDLALAQTGTKDVARIVEDEEWKSKELTPAARRFFTRTEAAHYALRCEWHQKHLAALDQLIAIRDHDLHPRVAKLVEQRFHLLLKESDKIADRLNEEEYEPEPANADDLNVTDED